MRHLLSTGDLTIDGIRSPIWSSSNSITSINFNIKIPELISIKTSNQAGPNERKDVQIESSLPTSKYLKPSRGRTMRLPPPNESTTVMSPQSLNSPKEYTASRIHSRLSTASNQSPSMINESLTDDSLLPNESSSYFSVINKINKVRKKKSSFLHI